MLKNPPRIPGTFFAHSLACECDPDRIIEDHQNRLHCGDCLTPLEKVSSRDLPDYDQEEILLKLKAQHKGPGAAGVSLDDLERDDD